MCEGTLITTIVKSFRFFWSWNCWHNIFIKLCSYIGTARRPHFHCLYQCENNSIKMFLFCPLHSLIRLLSLSLCTNSRATVIQSRSGSTMVRVNMPSFSLLSLSSDGWAITSTAAMKEANPLFLPHFKICSTSQLKRRYVPSFVQKSSTLALKMRHVRCMFVSCRHKTLWISPIVPPW